MAGADDHLVDVRRLEKNADAAAIVDVRAINQDIAAPSREVQAVPHLAYQHTTYSRHHGVAELDTIRFGMRADDLESVQRRHALTIPGDRLHRLRIGRALVVRPHQPESRAGARHDHRRAAALADQSKRADLRELDLDGAREPVASARKFHRAVLSAAHRRLDRRRVVGDAVTLGAKVPHAGPGRD